MSMRFAALGHTPRKIQGKHHARMAYLEPGHRLTPQPCSLNTTRNPKHQTAPKLTPKSRLGGGPNPRLRRGGGALSPALLTVKLRGSGVARCDVAVEVYNASDRSYSPFAPAPLPSDTTTGPANTNAAILDCATSVSLVQVYNIM